MRYLTPWRSRLCFRTCATLLLLGLSALAILFAFPGTHTFLKTPLTNGILLLLLGVLLFTTGRALINRRWLSALFHCGAGLVIIGGGITAGYAQDGQVLLTDSTYAPPEYRQFLLEGERIALHSFDILTYDNGMPKQYVSRLVFPDGVHEISVNAPLRRKGWTFYQMSYQTQEGPYGEPIFSTVLTLRKDPGVGFTFCGYGTLVLAAILLAIRETCRLRPSAKESIA